MAWTQSTHWGQGADQDPGQSPESLDVRWLREAQLDGPGRTRAQPLDRVGDDDAALLDDGQLVDHPLDLVEVVGGQEDRAALGNGLAEKRRELVLQERVEAGGGLVQDQQLGPVLEGKHEPDLLPVPLRQGAYRPVQLNPEPVDELVAHRVVDQLAS